LIRLLRPGPGVCNELPSHGSPDCRVALLPEALRMTFAEDVAPGFSFRRPRFVHFRRRPLLHYALNADSVRCASIGAAAAARQQ